MENKYLVTNPSSISLCIVGRKRFEIPAQCENFACHFTSEVEAKATIARLKRRYPFLKFEAVGDVPKAEAEKAEQKENTAPDAPALMDMETFTKKASVKRAGNGKYAVTVEGLEKPLIVQLSADEPAENAVPRAFEQYTGDHKE